MKTTTSKDWVHAARSVRNSAIENESKEVFIQTIFPGKKITLEYNNLKLRIRDLDKKTITNLRASGVPRFLTTSQYANWGGETPSILYIEGVFVRSRKKKEVQRFVATRVYGENNEQHHNQITSIQLLYARNFYTPIVQSSWMHTKEISPKTLRHRLQAKLNLRVETMDGRAFTPVEPIGLELFDCIGWKGKSNEKRARTKRTKGTANKIT